MIAEGREKYSKINRTEMIVRTSKNYLYIIKITKVTDQTLKPDLLRRLQKEERNILWLRTPELN